MARPRSFPIPCAGDTIGWYTVLGETRIFGRPRGRLRVLCRCRCGAERWVDPYLLRNGDAKSCGCWAKALASRPRGIVADGVAAVELARTNHAADLGYVVGVLAGDGYVGHRGTIRLAATDRLFVVAFSAAFKAAFGAAGPLRRTAPAQSGWKPVWTSSLASKPLASAIEATYGDLKTWVWRLPLHESDTFVAAFLAGFFDSEGHLPSYRSRLTATSVNAAGVGDVVAALRRLGIAAETTWTGHAWLITVLCRSWATFHDTVILRLPRKRRQSAMLAARAGRGRSTKMEQEVRAAAAAEALGGVIVRGRNLSIAAPCTGCGAELCRPVCDAVDAATWACLTCTRRCRAVREREERLKWVA